MRPGRGRGGSEKGIAFPRLVACKFHKHLVKNVACLKKNKRKYEIFERLRLSSSSQLKIESFTISFYRLF